MKHKAEEYKAVIFNLIDQLQKAQLQLENAGVCIEQKKYDEAILHCFSHNRLKQEAIDAGLKLIE